MFAHARPEEEVATGGENGHDGCNVYDRHLGNCDLWCSVDDLCVYRRSQARDHLRAARERGEGVMGKAERLKLQLDNVAWDVDFQIQEVIRATEELKRRKEVL